MSETQERYLVQCISGESSHVMQVIPGTQLEALCIQRAESGKLDALVLGPDECLVCVEKAQNRWASELWLSLGCPMANVDGNCDDDCPCKAEVADSPWRNQVMGMPLSV